MKNSEIFNFIYLLGRDIVGNTFLEQEGYSNTERWKSDILNIMSYIFALFSQTDLSQQTLDLNFLSSSPSVTLNTHLKY